MSESEVLIRVDGQVDAPRALSLADLRAIDAKHQVADVGQIVPGRRGAAVRLAAVLELARPKPDARYLGLHAGRDDFHASIPLSAVRDTALVVYALDGGPLAAEKGGPARLLIPDPAACHTDEIDECASLKFLDHIELTTEKGRDNRPSDDDEHEALHRDG